MKKYAITFIFILFSTFPSYSPGLWRKEYNKILYAFQNQQINELLRTLPFTPSNLELALEINIKHPEIVYYQAILETGWFKSHIFLTGNNLFGMKYPRSRNTTAINRYKHWAVYENWYDAVIDYKLWQEYWIEQGYNLDNYYLFLKDIKYCTSKNYYNLLEQIWKN